MAGTEFRMRIPVFLIPALFAASMLSLLTVQEAAGQEDIGLRFYNGTVAVPIAVEPLGTLTSPLRIYKNGNTYGIELVDPSHACASGVMILTSSWTRSLRIDGCVATYSVQVNLTINNLIRNYGPGGEDACKFPFELRSGPSMPMSVEIRDMSNVLIGAAKSITTDQLWGVGNVISSNPVTLVPGQQYRIIISPQQGRMYDTPFFNAYGIHPFGDANGVGGYDFGCVTPQQYFQQTAAAGCTVYSGSSYVNYMCDGTMIPQHCAAPLIPDPGVCGLLWENDIYTYSCGENPYLDPWNYRKNMVCAYNDFPPAGDCFPEMQYYGCLPDISSQGFSPDISALFTAGTLTTIFGDKGVTIDSGTQP